MKREGRRHISTAKKVPRSDQIQVLPWGNTFTDPPHAHAGLPVRLEHLYKFSSVIGMFSSALMSPGGAGMRWEGAPI